MLRSQHTAQWIDQCFVYFIIFILLAIGMDLLLWESECILCVSDVVAERSWRTESWLCSDGPGEHFAAGGVVQHAGPSGLCWAFTEQHKATTCRPAPVPATNTPAGTGLSTLSGQTNWMLLSYHIKLSLLLTHATHTAFHWLWFCLFQSQRSSLTLQPQQNPLPMSLYNTMMIPQQSPANVVQIATSLAQNTGPNTPAVAAFAQDRAAQIRFAFLHLFYCHGYNWYISRMWISYSVKYF